MDRSKLWESIEFIMFNADRKKNAESEVPDIINLLKIKKDERILDLCCGVGRHTLRFARLGFNVTGVDITKQYLDKIKKTAMDENLNIELIHSDMTKFKSENEFDVIYNLWDSFGMNPIEDDYRCLQNVFTSLKPKGRFIMEISTTEVTAKRFVAKKWYFEDGMYILKDRVPDKDLRGLLLRWIIIKDNQEFKFEKYVYQYTAYELVESLKKAGFKKINLFENFKGDKYDYNSNNLVLVAYK